MGDRRQRTVILGNGGAAVECIRALRECGYNDDIDILSDNGVAPYNPMLTTYYVAGKISYDQLFPFGPDNEFYQKYQVRTALDSPAVAVDTANRIVTNKAGSRFPYDKCLVATGASPIMPPIPGIGSKRVHAMRTLQDALSLKKALASAPKLAVVVGASLIGIKLVELFANEGIEVCLADVAGHLFPLAAHPDCAQVLERQLRERKIRLRLGAAIDGIEENGPGIRAYFKDGGAPEEADLLVMCIGVRPNTEFLDRAHVGINKGVLVDEHMKTNADGLYAAGDVAEGQNLQTGKHQLIGLWANARYQGRAAGRHMVNMPIPYPGSIPHNITHFMDMTFAAIGDVTGSDRETKFIDGDKYAQLFWKHGRLSGANLINCNSKSGTLKHMLIKDLILGRVAEEEALELFELHWKQDYNYCLFPMWKKCHHGQDDHGC
jgi:NADPH-dependent 2,4-dienoyl-CoA reductase/sulfur reductase-like enzyme